MKSCVIPYIKDLDRENWENTINILDENGVSISVDSANWFGKFSYKPLTTVHIGYDKSSIYISFHVNDNYLRACYTKDQSPVNEDSCVEFFMKLPESDYYYNFEFNCIGVCRAAKHFKTRDSFTNLTDEQLNEICRWSSLGKQPFNELNGIFSWDLCINIPFNLFCDYPDRLPEKIMGNFYKCADKTEQPHYISWNPINTEKPDFHRPEFFGELILGPDKV